MKCLEIYGKPVPLHCVFHGIRFKVNGRLVVEMTTFFFLKRCVRVDAPLLNFQKMRVSGNGGQSEKGAVRKAGCNLSSRFQYYAHNLDSLNKKNGMSATPLN